MSYLAELSNQELQLYRKLHLVPLAHKKDGIHIAISREQYDQRDDLLDSDVSIIWHAFSPTNMDTLLAAAYGVHILEGEDFMISEALKNRLSQDNIRHAAARHERTGEPVGDILASEGHVTESELNRLRAAYYELLPASEDAVADSHAREIMSFQESTRLRAVPLRIENDVLHIMSDRTHVDLDRAHVLHLAPTRQLDLLSQDVYQEDFAHEAVSSLAESRPDLSAHRVLSTGQKFFFVLLLLAVIIGFIFWAQTTAIILIAVASVIYVLTGSYRIFLLFRSLGSHHEIQVTADEIVALDERDLPIYTILVPLYKEAGIMKRLTDDLAKLDYPTTRLDIKLLCEEDDEETIEAIRSLNLPPQYHLLIVPDSQPKTKPKACNYGLTQARGKYVVIFDAEDDPDIHQLKKAVIAFRQVPEEVVCIQAKLNYYNYDQNVLTRLFSVEYSMHFDLLLPGLNASNAPIPLGGTSNHFVTQALVDLGGWDPFNVTEDADLGIRLARSGYRTNVMDSTTLEEANSKVGNWINQRSRWVKGYMQTWLVHMRNPVKLLSELGVKNFVSFNLMFAVTLAFLLNPIFWAMTTIFILTQWELIESVFPWFIYYPAAVMLIVGNFMFFYINIVGSAQHGAFGLIRWALLSPIYWGLISWAAWKGFIQLFTKPFYWEKTEHGLDGGDSQ